MIQTNISTILAKLAECGSAKTVDKALQSIPIDKLVDLLTPDMEEWHENVFAVIMSLARAGKAKAIERMFASGVDRNLVRLLENGSEVAQHHAIVTLKIFYELGGSLAHRSLRPGTLTLLPWQARVSLEKFVLPDKSNPLSPKPQNFEDLIHKILEKDQKQVLEGMQDLILIIENANEPRIRDMIIQSPLIEKLSDFLQLENTEYNSTRSQSSFLLMKLACSGGDPCIHKILEYEVVPKLVKMMQCNVVELQDSAYTALHQMLFGEGGGLVLNRILQMGLIEKILYSVESKSIKTREVCVNCIVDLVQLGNKACIEKMFSLQVAERLTKLGKNSGGSGELIIAFLNGIDRCKHLSTTEKRVMKQQVIRKVRAALKGHKHEARMIASIEASSSEGSGGASGKRK